MADEVARAQELEERQRAAAVAMQRAKPHQLAFVPAACVDCSDKIEPERHAAMPTARRCAECEKRREKSRRLKNMRAR